MTDETTEARLKRLRMRSWRRGIKEMDLILGPFADTAMADLGEAELATYDALLSENDQDLYRWVTGQEEPPERFEAILTRVARHAGAI